MQLVAELDYIVEQLVAEAQILVEVVEMVHMTVDSIVHSVLLILVDYTIVELAHSPLVALASVSPSMTAL